jgi:DNA-binding response OmpR family regulator
MSRRVLVVEDDSALGGQIVDRLRRAGFECDWCRTGTAAMELEPQGYDLVVLDLMLPGVFGLDVLKAFRERADVPVVVLSARNETTTKIRALELGADDYVTKPFWPDELLARLEARLRRPALQKTDILEQGPLRIDLGARRLFVSGREVEVTKIEFDILASLGKRPGTAVSRTWLVQNVLDPDREGTERTLDVHVSRLRKKLGALGARVVTVWGVGYRLEDES